MIGEIDPSSSTRQAIDEQIQAGIRLYNNDPAQALLIANAALASSQEIGYYQGIAQTLRIRAMANGVRNEVALAEEDFRSALQWSIQLGDGLLEARCRLGLATAYRHQSLFSRALEEWYRAILLFREADNPIGVINCLSNIGTVHGELGNYGAAIEHILEAKRLAQETSNGRHTLMLYDTLALVYDSCGEREKALEVFAEGVRAAEKIDNRYTLCNLLSNYASVLGRAGRFAEGVPIAERALSLANEIGNPERQMLAFVTIAELTMGLGDLVEAEKILEEALDWGTHTHVSSSSMHLYLWLGRVKSRLPEKQSEARGYLEKALTLAQAKQLKLEIADIYHSLSELSESEGDFRMALKQHQLYHEAYVVLQKESARNRLLAQNAQSEAEQARKETEQERQRNAELLAAQTKQEHLLEELEQRALRDSLTGMFNRRHADEVLDRELENLGQPESRLCIALGDIDNFKRINDTFSHGVGDIVLRTAAALMHSVIPDTPHDPQRLAFLARYGGEEWMAVLPGYTEAEAIAWAESARTILLSYDWSQVAEGLRVSISFGIAEVSHEKTETRESLRGRADERLYRAKRSGKNRVIAS